MSAMPKDVFFLEWVYGRKPMYSRWNYITISCLVTEIRSLPVYVRHIVVSDIDYCQPCQITCSCPWVNPKHPYCVLEFLKYVIRCQKNLTTETCYIPAHFQNESTFPAAILEKWLKIIENFFCTS
jgi:hypothetical protein